jgi:hypothetical protein
VTHSGAPLYTFHHHTQGRESAVDAMRADPAMMEQVANEVNGSLMQSPGVLQELVDEGVVLGDEDSDISALSDSDAPGAPGV